MRILFSSVFQINLRLILVSGKTKEFLFSPNDSAADIAKHVYDNWPMGKWLLVPVAIDKEEALSIAAKKLHCVSRVLRSY